MTRSHRTKQNDGKPYRGRNGAALELGRSKMSKTVMIVEDNELNMKLFHDLLEAHGYHAQRHRGARFRLQAPSRFDPDGHSAARNLRSRSDQVAQGRP